MFKICLTGASGFVGLNLLKYFSDSDSVFTPLSLRTFFDKDSIKDCDIIIHAAGKAHDLKNVSQPEEYYTVNYEMTKKLYDMFLLSDAETFIFISSVKAVTDHADKPLAEDQPPQPQTHYGKSKLMAEEYILSNPPQAGKRFYILRPCMMHGPGNKGNLNLLYKLILLHIPWPLGAFDNRRSFLSIENMCFVVKQLIQRKDIPSGVYHVADNDTLSTNELVGVIAKELKRRMIILRLPKKMIVCLAKIGNKLSLPFNESTLQKLTDNYIVSNKKLIDALGTPLPVKAKEGVTFTVRSFSLPDKH